MADKPFLNSDGHLDFAPDDSRGPKNWSTKRKCYITGVSILLVINATFASSAPSGAFEGISEDLYSRSCRLSYRTVSFGILRRSFNLGSVVGVLRVSIPRKVDC
jgi:hypothetical protein